MAFEAPDILSPLPPVTGTTWAGGIILALIGLLAGLLIVWAIRYRRYRPRRSVRRLRRALQRQRITPRRAAHALAAVLRARRVQGRLAKAGTLLDELDALRFRREPPSSGQLLGLIVRAERAPSGRLHDD